MYMTLQPIIDVLNQSTAVKDLVTHNQHRLNQRKTHTQISAIKLTAVSHFITTDTSHLWYDFMFLLPTAQ